METVFEASRTLPVCGTYDLCVIGGSATGVFAAVRAARMGLRVAIVEQTNCFGGTTTNSSVANWHSLLDTQYERQIIGGLIQEVLDRLQRRRVLHFEPRTRNAYFFNTEELKLELDDMVVSHRIDPYLNAFLSAAHVEEDRIDSAIIEDKSGRRAIRAQFYVDAGGDGDLAVKADAGFEQADRLQPGTCVYRTTGLPPREAFDLTRCIAEHGAEFGLAPDMGWYYPDPTTKGIFFHYDTHTFAVNGCDADNLSRAEIRGRAQAKAVIEMIKAYAPAGTTTALVDLPARLGIRETRHIHCLHRVSGEELLQGTRFEDGVANGTYPPDIHDPDTGETILRYLDGSEVITKAGGAVQKGRWRPPAEQDPRFYQIPYRALVCRGLDNLAIAGRCIDADPWAFGALRVQVNCMQMGEAAGTAAALAFRSGISLSAVDAKQLRNALAQGGSIVL